MEGTGPPPPDDLAAGVRRGDVRAIARALTLVENAQGTVGWGGGGGGGEAVGAEGAADALLRALAGGPRAAHRVGVTGAPGVGKSTLVAALARAWRALGRRVAVVAVDPTSPFSGGALLGDRVRMGALSGDAGAYVRSFASRGATGGLARAVGDATDVLEAAGFDVVLVETVGAGQGEVAIAGEADTVVVVAAPGGGDAVQAMKGGLLETADLLVVNQADRPGADDLAGDLEAGVALRTHGRRPAVLLASATDGRGIDALREAIDAHGAATREDGERATRRVARARARVVAAVDREAAARWWAGRERDLERAARDVAEGRATVAEAARDLRAGRG